MKLSEKSWLRSAAVLGAGAAWGFTGFAVRHLADLGFTSGQALLARLTIAAVLFAVTILIEDRSLFRIRLRDFWCFIGTGVCAMLLNTYCYFEAVERLPLATAAILMYTAPAIVTVVSVPVFHERFTLKKLLALLLAFAGCCLVSGFTGGKLPVAGVLFGLGSGLCYAAYSVFARLAMDRGYHARTVNFYSCALASLGALAVWGDAETAGLVFGSAGGLLWSLIAGGAACYLPYLLYTWGLERTEAGKAAIMSSVEPVVAAIFGVLAYRETIGVSGWAGVCLVLSAVVLLSVRTGETARLKPGAASAK